MGDTHSESTPIFDKLLTPFTMGFKEVLVTAHNFVLSEIFSARILGAVIQCLGLPVGSCIAGLVAVVTFYDVQTHSLNLKHPYAIFSNILNIASCFYCKLFLYPTYLEFEDIY